MVQIEFDSAQFSNVVRKRLLVLKTTRSQNIQRVNILGVGLSAVNPSLAINEIDRFIENDVRTYICVRDAHGIIQCQRNPDLRIIHNNAGLVVPDGMPMVWISRWRGHAHVSRVYGPGLMLDYLLHSVKKKRRHFFYGGGEGVPEKLKHVLCDKFPRLQVVGTLSPPFRPLTREEDENVIRQINKTCPDMVWVGLSTPKQEKWMADHLGRINAPVMVGVGAAFDFNAGLKKTAPEWMQKSGLEWSFRVMTEPRRLWRRYLWVIPMFIILNLLQLLGILRYSLDE